MLRRYSLDWEEHIFYAISRSWRFDKYYGLWYTTGNLNIFALVSYAKLQKEE